MPEDLTPETAPKKRAPRKRAAPRVAAQTDGKSTSRRRTAAAPRRQTATPADVPIDTQREAAVPLARPVRKSPTPLSAIAAAKQQQKRQRVIIGGILLAGIAASAGVGFTDTGKVDIEARIEARNERIRNNTPTEQDLVGGVDTITVAEANSARPAEADGGMTGRGTGGNRSTSAPAAEVKTATTTVDVVDGVDDGVASTSPETGTSTLAVMGEVAAVESPADTSDSDTPPGESPE